MADVIFEKVIKFIENNLISYFMHHHKPSPNEDPDFTFSAFCARCNPAYIIAASIILGAIILAATLIYGTGKINTKIEESAFLAGSSSQGAVQVPSAPNPVGQQPSAPTGPVNVTERADAPTLGNKNAKVTIYEFSDFQCPYCQRFFTGAYEQIKKDYIDTGKAKLVYRHFPLSFHNNAEISGRASECASRQGKFWEYHDVLFKNGQPDGTGLDAASLKKYATQLGIGNSKFNQCLDNNETASAVKADMDSGIAAGVSGTPTFYINGKQLVGALPAASFAQAIEEALKQ